MSIDNPVARVTKVVTNLVTSEEMFTLLDVTKAVQSDGGAFIRHLDLKEVSKPIVEMLTALGTQNVRYETEVIDVHTKNGVVTAVLYFPDYEDPENYIADKSNPGLINVYKSTGTTAPKTQPKMQKVQPTAKPNKAVATGSAPSWASGSKYFKVVQVRADGNVEIPLKALVASGLYAEEVIVGNHPNSLSLVSTGNASPTTNNAGMRVTKRNLIKSNLKGDKVGVAAFNGKVVLTRA